MHRLFQPIIVVSLVRLAACSSSGEVKVSKPMAVRVDHSDVAALSVTSSASVDSSDAEIREVMQRLQGVLFGRLVSEGVFKQVVHENEPSQYLVDVKLMDADEVSQGARIFFGVLAGSNSLVVSVTLIDMGKNERVTEFVVTGKSASHPLSSENDMDDAIREVVDEIILALR